LAANRNGWMLRLIASRHDDDDDDVLAGQAEKLFMPLSVRIGIVL